MTQLKPLFRLHNGSRTRLRTLAVAGTAMLALASFAVVNARPALADPAKVYVAVGSETTQDFMNGFASDLGVNTIASYNAVNPVTQNEHEIITPAKVGPPGLTAASPDQIATPKDWAHCASPSTRTRSGRCCLMGPSRPASTLTARRSVPGVTRESTAPWSSFRSRSTR